jgi:hypothetical protein
MNADPTPKTADERLLFAAVVATQYTKLLSAAIGVGSAFIGASNDFRPRHS